MKRKGSEDTSTKEGTEMCLQHILEKAHIHVSLHLILCKGAYNMELVTSLWH